MPAVASRSRTDGRRFIAGLLLAWACQGWLATAGAADAAGAPPAAAPSPVTQHYRAYVQALDRGDLSVAETEAASALAASVAQYGEGGRTAVLAVNLAGVRLARREYAAAVEPARQALAIAEKQGDASGVDVHVARLLLGRAELPGGDAAAMERLLQAVHDAQGEPGLEAEAYPAAVELAVAAFGAKRYTLARDAWIASAAFAEGSRVNRDYALARAKQGEAAARVMVLAKHRAGTGEAPLSEFAALDAILAEAMDLVHDQAMQGTDGGELTLAQSVLGEALALKDALRAKLRSEQKTLKNPTAPQNQVYIVNAASDPRPPCEVRGEYRPLPKFPPKELVENGLGTIALKLRVDESGTVTRAQVAGSVGGKAFADSVVLAAQHWQLEKVDGAASGCRVARDYFMSVRFVY